MTEHGWKDLQNLTEQFQQPFQLFREGDRTLLQVLENKSVVRRLSRSDAFNPLYIALVDTIEPIENITVRSDISNLGWDE